VLVCEGQAHDNQNLRVKPERNPHSASGLNHFSLGFPFEDFALVVIGLAAALKTLKLNRKPFLLSYTTCFSHVVCGVGKERVLPVTNKVFFRAHVFLGRPWPFPSTFVFFLLLPCFLLHFSVAKKTKRAREKKEKSKCGKEMASPKGRWT